MFFNFRHQCLIFYRHLRPLQKLKTIYHAYKEITLMRCRQDLKNTKINVDRPLIILRPFASFSSDRLCLVGGWSESAFWLSNQGVRVSWLLYLLVLFWLFNNSFLIFWRKSGSLRELRVFSSPFCAFLLFERYPIYLTKKLLFFPIYRYSI